MNIELPQRSIAAVHELVRLSSTHNENVTRLRFSLLIADSPPGPALNHVNNLVVIMLVQSRSPARLTDHQKERDPDTIMVRTNKLVGHSHKRKL